ncbi:hypothetical protein ACFTPM_11200, partial [Brevibacterium sp. NPDC056947]
LVRPSAGRPTALRPRRPALLTRASSKVAEAVLAASMARAGTATLTSTATAADRYITDAAELLAQVRRILAEADAR